MNFCCSAGKLLLACAPGMRRKWNEAEIIWWITEVPCGGSLSGGGLQACGDWEGAVELAEAG
jgi:hypothetical protein